MERKNSSPRVAPRGTQSLERGAKILRELASRPRVGWGLTELALRCELDKATTHRILAGLVRERLAAHHPLARRYVPGPLLFELGLGIDSHSRIQAAGQESVRRIVRRHGGIAALTLASGYDAVCCAHYGKLATRAVSFAVGDRRPLVMNAAGVAMLIQLPAAEARAAMSYGLRRAAHLGEHRLRLIRDMVENSSKVGFGLNQSNSVAGITGVAVAILQRKKVPIAAIGISGINDQFPPESIPALVETLKREADILARASGSELQ